MFDKDGRVNRKETFSAILNEIRDGKTAKIEFEAAGRRYIRRFIPEERLILLGGGHISVPLCKIAAILGFSVTVVDDRPLFANNERFPEASMVICDRFESAVKNLQIRSEDYVCVITRGHRWDGECLRTLLCGTYPSYLGMIGSRRRVAGLLSLLKEEGFEERKLALIHAPIGLDINAETPAEIAVSICAEMVHHRRGNHSYDSKEILKRTDTDEALLRFLAEPEIPKVLMVVISTEGSTPVETGAIMSMDHNKHTRGTIGGGCGEAEVMSAAYRMLGTGTTRIIHVDLTNDISEEGMTCGGIMTVLIEDITE